MGDLLHRFFKERETCRQREELGKGLRRRGTLPVLNPPAVTLQKLLYPGTPLCNLEAKDPAATLAHLGWREKHPLWSQAETGSDPGSTSGLG